VLRRPRPVALGGFGQVQRDALLAASAVPGVLGAGAAPGRWADPGGCCPGGNASNRGDLLIRPADCLGAAVVMGPTASTLPARGLLTPALSHWASGRVVMWPVDGWKLLFFIGRVAGGAAARWPPAFGPQNAAPAAAWPVDRDR